MGHDTENYVAVPECTIFVRRSTKDNSLEFMDMGNVFDVIVDHVNDSIHFKADEWGPEHVALWMNIGDEGKPYGEENLLFSAPNNSGYRLALYDIVIEWSGACGPTWKFEFTKYALICHPVRLDIPCHQFEAGEVSGWASVEYKAVPSTFSKRIASCGETIIKRSPASKISSVDRYPNANPQL